MVRAAKVDVQEERPLAVGFQEFDGLARVERGLVEIFRPRHGRCLELPLVARFVLFQQAPARGGYVRAAPSGGFQARVILGIGRDHPLESAQKLRRRERQLPRASRQVAMTAQHRGQRLLFRWQLVQVRRRAVGVRITARVQRRARWHALRALDEPILEQRALGCQAVDVGRAQDRVSHAAERVGAVLVAGDQQQVPALGRGRRGHSAGRHGEQFSARGSHGGAAHFLP